MRGPLLKKPAKDSKKLCCHCDRDVEPELLAEARRALKKGTFDFWCGYCRVMGD